MYYLMETSKQFNFQIKKNAHSSKIKIKVDIYTHNYVKSGQQTISIYILDEKESLNVVTIAAIIPKGENVSLFLPNPVTVVY